MPRGDGLQDGYQFAEGDDESEESRLSGVAEALMKLLPGVHW